MNRLIIVGNGFDLAHGLKTSYADFMLDYLKGLVKPLVDNYPSILVNQDKLIEVKIEDHNSFQYQKENIENINTLSEFYKNMYVNGLEIKGLTNLSNSILIHLNEHNWVDIENIYYILLTNSIHKRHTLKPLNNDLDFLRQKLIDYLKKIELEIDKEIHNRNLSAIKKLFSQRKDSSLNSFNTAILNFNYTKLIQTYLTKIPKDKNLGETSEIQIHGNLSDADSIVFGFGDELDKHYQEIEDLNENLFFEHIKSFKYFQNSHYQDLMRFVDAGPFEVYVMGHSLGLSDRTMFTQIFESDNLDKVHLFYYKRDDGTDDFTEKTYEISRHFKDKGRMRKKIVDKSNSKPLPQIGTT